MPTEQDILDWMDAVEAWPHTAKIWKEDAIEAIQKNQAIGSNPPTPPPPPPGCSY